MNVLQVEDGPYKYKFVPVNEHCTWRVKSMFSKEPDTIEWLSKMQPGETLVDVGANIGIYTIYAAVRGVKVYAFEPEALNYAILNQNIWINGGNVIAYCCALTTDLEPDVLNLSSVLPGGSCHSYKDEVDHRLEKRKATYRQGCFGVPLDWFMGMEKADYVKIDVDGFEHKVVSGGVNTIKDAKSVLIEINQNLPEHRDLVDQMLEWGFKYDHEQVEKARRKEGAFINCGNYIFYK